MTEQTTYDVAVIGYGPTGATAANLLGQLGLKVLVIERDPDVTAGQGHLDRRGGHAGLAVGRTGRSPAARHAARPSAEFVDANGDPFIEMKITPRGCGHPPQQFLYQPAVDHVLREGVARFPNVERAVEHDACRRRPRATRSSCCCRSSHRHFQAGERVLCDGRHGGSSRPWQLGVGYSGRTYAERWVVIDTKVRTAWDAHDSLRFHCTRCVPLSTARPHSAITDGSIQHARTRTNRHGCAKTTIWKVLNDQGITKNMWRSCAR